MIEMEILKNSRDKIAHAYKMSLPPYSAFKDIRSSAASKVNHLSTSSAKCFLEQGGAVM